MVYKWVGLRMPLVSVWFLNGNSSVNTATHCLGCALSYWQATSIVSKCPIADLVILDSPQLRLSFAVHFKAADRYLDGAKPRHGSRLTILVRSGERMASLPGEAMPSASGVSAQEEVLS